MRSRSGEHRNVLFLSVCLISIPLFLLVGLVIWACDSNLEESVPGVGQMTPKGSIRTVMSPNSGVVRKIFVQKNDAVKAGQILMELDPEQPQIENKGIQEQLAYLRDESAALQAAFHHSSPGHLNSSLEQKAWLGATQQALSSELSQARHQIEESEHSVNETSAQIQHTETILHGLQEQQKRYHNLYEEDGIPMVEVQSFDEKVSQSQRELATLKETYKVRRSELDKNKKRPAELLSMYDKEILTRLAEHRRNIAQLQSSQELSQVNLNRTVIRAPIDGVIHEQSVFGPGDVVPGPSEKLFSIVPDEAHLVAEVKVTNRDFSYIRMHQKAALRLDALPYNQFGRLDGKVTAISPSTTLDPEGNPYYLIRIEPDKNWLQDSSGKKHHFRSGMTVTADILTREKTIISFFTDPVQSQLDTAFRDPTTR